MGFGNTSSVGTPQVVDMEETVVDVSCGYEHTLVVTASGKVYAWGNNKHGAAAGVDAGSSLTTPSLVHVPVAVKAVAAGRHHSLALGVDNTVWAWGWGGSFMSGAGALGIGSQVCSAQ